MEAIYVSSINQDVHVIRQLHFIRGSGGIAPSPKKPKNVLKKSNKMEAFTFKVRFFIFYFFTFWQCSLNPQNYEQ